MDEAVRTTNDWMAAIRAHENELPDAYLRDPYAHLLAPADITAAVELLHDLNSPTPVVVVRGRFGDEALRQAAAQGVRQVVSLGAGTDTRAYRLGLGLEDVHFFELDLPGQLSLKAEVLARQGIRPQSQLTMIDVDLREDWLPHLERAGHRKDQPTAWVIEGLFYYLNPRASDDLIAKLTSRSAPGSTLQLDIPAESYYDDSDNQSFLEYTANRGSPWAGSSADPTAWLANHGWHAESYLPETLDECPWLPTPPARLSKAYHHLWLVHAVNDEVHAVNDEVHAVNDEVRAVIDEVRAVNAEEDQSPVRLSS